MAGPFFDFQTTSFTPEVHHLMVQSFTMTERMSQPYEIAIRLIVPKDAGVQPEKMIGESATLTIYQAMGGARMPHPVNGVVFAARREGSYESDYDRLYLTVRPRLWQLSLSERSRTWSHRSVPEVVEDVLINDNEFVATDFRADYSELRVHGVEAPHRTTIAQYRESDLNFVHRWLEHEGIYYYFEQDADAGNGRFKERIVFETDTVGYGEVRPGTPIEGEDPRSVFDVEEASEGDDDPAFGAKEVILELNQERAMLPREVVIHDYEPRAAERGTSTRSATIDEKGFGTRQDENNYFFGLSGSQHPDPVADGQQYGDMLAAIRAEGFLSRQTTFSGRSNARTFRAGHVFRLNAPDFELREAYLLLTEVVHHGFQYVTGGSIGFSSYHNEFTAVPGDSADPVYRPARTTPWPTISGYVHGTVGADPGDATEHADLDADGQYTVITGFADDDHDGSRTYQTVRRAQPMAGAPEDNHEVGIHFPLYTGSEVLMAYQDGDPDRPIILGAIPNSQSTDVLSHRNDLNVIRTRSKSQIVFDDRRESEGIVINGGSDGTILRLGTPLGESPDDAEKLLHHIGSLEPDTESVYQDTDEGAFAEGDPSIYLGAAASIYLASKKDVAISADRFFAMDVGEDAALKYRKNLDVAVQGDEERHIHGDFEGHVDGKYDLHVKGDLELESDNYWEHCWGHSGETFVGTKVEFAFSGRSDMTGGGAFELFIGAKIDVNLSLTAAVEVGASIALHLSAEAKIGVEKSVHLWPHKKEVIGDVTSKTLSTTIDTMAYTVKSGGTVLISGDGMVAVNSAGLVRIGSAGVLKLNGDGGVSITSQGPISLASSVGVVQTGPTENVTVT